MKNYQAPELMFVLFGSTDVITASNGTSGGTNDNIANDEHWTDSY